MVCTTIGTLQVNEQIDKEIKEVDFSSDISTEYLFVRLFPSRTWARNRQILYYSVSMHFTLKLEFKSAWGTRILMFFFSEFKLFSSMITSVV